MKIANDQEIEVFGDGSQLRNFVHVSDVCRFTIKLLKYNGKHYFNLRSNLTVTIKELSEQLLLFRNSDKKTIFRPEYMKYEVFKIQNFDLTDAERCGWSYKVDDLQIGLSV